MKQRKIAWLLAITMLFSGTGLGNVVSMAAPPNRAFSGRAVSGQDSPLNSK